MKSLAHKPRIPLGRVDGFEHAVGIDFLQLVDQDHRRVAIGGNVARQYRDRAPFKVEGGLVIAVDGHFFEISIPGFARVEAQFIVRFAGQHLTSFAVNGLPSCHLTPWRSGRVSSVPSSLHDQLVARSGTIDCRLLVESEVFETPAVIDAVGHDSRVLQVRPAAGCEPHSGGGADVHHLQPIFARSPSPTVCAYGPVDRKVDSSSIDARGTVKMAYFEGAALLLRRCRLHRRNQQRPLQASTRRSRFMVLCLLLVTRAEQTRHRLLPAFFGLAYRRQHKRGYDLSDKRNRGSISTLDSAVASALPQAVTGRARGLRSAGRCKCC